jgi:ubiquinone biosynthesis protein
MIHPLENIGRTIGNLQRYRDIVIVFMKYGYEDIAHRLRLPTSLKIPFFHRKSTATAPHLPAPVRLRLALEELGPTFIKMGQLLCSRSDFLPENFILELAKLQENVAPLPFPEIKQVVEQSLKAPLDQVYSFVEETPLGSASIAQVHRARLMNGTAVVIKVQRPGIQKIIEVDVQIMRHLAALIESYIDGWRIYQPARVVEQIARSLVEEIDFTIEAGHIDRFAWQFTGDPRVHAPRVHRHATTKVVLTMDYIDGIQASRLDELDAANVNRGETAKRIADLLIEQMFIHGFFHADPHPGNIRILPDQTIGFLDFGMMGFLDRGAREVLADLAWGIARRNEIGVANALAKMGSNSADTSPEGLEGDVAEFMHQHFYRPMGEVSFGRLLTQLLQITARHNIQIGSEYFTMLKSLSLMENLVRQLNPDHDIVQQAIPALRKVRLDRFRPKRIADYVFEFGFDLANLAREAPSEIRRMLAQLRKGEAKVVFKHDGLEPLISSLERTSNRLAFAVVLASLIIGSSVIVHADIPPTWNGIPIIGLGGFVIAAFMGFWLLISIIRHGRM